MTGVLRAPRRALVTWRVLVAQHALATRRALAIWHALATWRALATRRALATWCALATGTLCPTLDPKQQLRVEMSFRPSSGAGHQFPGAESELGPRGGPRWWDFEPPP